LPGSYALHKEINNESIFENFYCPSNLLGRQVWLFIVSICQVQK
jgi:hypothetical protein